MKKRSTKQEWKKNRILGAAILALVLSGCSLARPESGGADREIGLFILDEETDNWLEENQPAQGRIYADLTMEEGTPSAADFGDLAGTYSMAYLETDTEEEGVSYATLAGEDITDVRLTIGAGDGEEVKLESVLLLPAGRGEYAVFYRHIYETADGRVYLDTEREEAGHVLDETDGVTSMTFERRATGSASGTRAFSQTLGIRIVPADADLVLGQYSAEGALLKEETFAPEDLPDRLAWEAEAAWLLVRRDKTDGTSLYEAYTRNVPETGEDRYRGPVEAYALENGRLCIHAMELEPEE